MYYFSFSNEITIELTRNISSVHRTGTASFFFIPGFPRFYFLFRFHLVNCNEPFARQLINSSNTKPSKPKPLKVKYMLCIEYWGIVMPNGIKEIVQHCIDWWLQIGYLLSNNNKYVNKTEEDKVVTGNPLNVSSVNHMKQKTGQDILDKRTNQ